ncbi:MAG: YopX family protein [Roseovarius sp.]|jgi:uncharacterized phage protein (TIGR01671 family)
MSRHDFRIWDIDSSKFVDKITSDDVIIQQSTGKMDRNDVEIYEGDIVHIDFVDVSGRELVIKAEIVWDEDRCGFVEKWTGPDQNLGIHSFLPLTCTVVNNIFNKE